MEVSQHIAALEREGELLARAVSRASPDAAIPTCPDWQMRDLVHHTGMVHRWATSHVTQPRARDFDAEEVVGASPPDESLLSWFGEGHARLVAALREAPADVACWTFLPAPSGLAFWARRQAHETAIHRADAEGATGSITAFDPDLAADGIDELLFGFVPRPRSRPRPERSCSLHLHATDIEGEWLARMGPDDFTATRGHAKADCAVRGTASDLHLLLWNRRGTDGLEVLGDRGILDIWRQGVRVRWA